MKPSGISKSKAQFWGIFCPFNNQEYELFVIDRKILKKMINDQEFLMNKKTNDNSFFVLFNNSYKYKLSKLKVILLNLSIIIFFNSFIGFSLFFIDIFFKKNII